MGFIALALQVTVLTITSSAPPLTPAQAAAVLRGGRSPQDLTDYRGGVATWALVGEYIRVPPNRQALPISTAPAFRPLNCCSAYVNGHPATPAEAARAIDRARLREGSWPKR